MSRVITQQKDTDFVWDYSRLQDRYHVGGSLIIFHQGERGFATFLAGMGMIGHAKPVCRIFSKLFLVDAYNTAPDPTFPEWRLFEIYDNLGTRHFVLRVTHSYPLPESKDADNSWLYTYPTIRDIVMELNNFGIDSMTYMTSNLLQTSPSYNTEQFAVMHPKELAIFDYMKHEEVPKSLDGQEYDNDIILSTPAWTFGCVFKNFCTSPIKYVRLLISGTDTQSFIDWDTFDSYKSYWYDYHSIVTHDDIIIKLKEILGDLEILTSGKTLDRIMADEFGGETHDYI